MKKVFLGLAVLMALPQAKAAAQVLTCGAKMVKSVCGSGEIKISVDTASGKFDLQNGDLTCWFFDSANTQGQATSVPTRYPYFDTKTFLLQRPDPLNATLTQDFAKLSFDEIRNVARLELLVQDPGILSKKYDLNCQ